MQNPQAQTHNLFHLSTCVEMKDRVFESLKRNTLAFIVFSWSSLCHSSLCVLLSPYLCSLFLTHPAITKSPEGEKHWICLPLLIENKTK